MLARADRILALACWLVAAALVLMLFAGPELVAEDKAPGPDAKAAGAAPYSSSPGGASAADGEQLFKDNCGSCHTLSAAGTSGTVGPNLDDVSLDASAIEDIVRGGRGGMPAFGDKLSDDEVSAVAAFVAGN